MGLGVLLGLGILAWGLLWLLVFEVLVGCWMGFILRFGDFGLVVQGLGLLGFVLFGNLFGFRIQGLRAAEI